MKKAECDIVVIGASAGGLEAVTQLLQNLHVNTGMIFFYIQHLSAEYNSTLSAILGKKTQMKVQEVVHGMKVIPNNLYINSPGRQMKLTNGIIHLTKFTSRPQKLPIDAFFNAVSELQGCKAISVILSGTGNDGSKGTVSIKNAGGLTFAQNDSAKFGSMPQSAIATGKIDYVLSPKEIGIEISTLGKKKELKKLPVIAGQKNLIQDSNPDLAVILDLIQKEAGIDFSYYKMATIKRRIERRMLLYSIPDIKEYAELLLHKKEEINILFQDLLINVTDFFRDTETHEYLKTKLFPKILSSKTEGQPFRIWIPACSTGEEAYSIAMNLLELIDGKELNMSIQIFASDLSAKAIAKARLGEYTAQEIASVSPKRLQRFYVKSGTTYRINKVVRDICIFAFHNILNDPPFSHVDVISCCNMMIYMDSEAQMKILKTFHYALNEGGYLILGKSETIGSAVNLFTQVGKKLKIYQKKEASGVRTFPDLLPGIKPKTLPLKTIIHTFKETKIHPDTFFGTTLDAILLSRFIPASVVINQQMDILQFRGASELFLKHTPGKADLNLIKMSPPELAYELRSAVSNVLRSGEDISIEDIEVKTGKVTRYINIVIVPLIKQKEDQLLLIVFKESEKSPAPSRNPGKKENETIKDTRIKKLEAALAMAQNNMAVYAQEQEAFTEELQSATEEVVSSNEELQSVNEELETSKEEIESTNEELLTTNQELQTRNELLNESYEYSEAIIKTMHDSMVILDKDLIIKSANQSFYKQFSITEKETVGFVLYDLANKQWALPELRKLLESIILNDTMILDFEITTVFPGVGEKVLLLNANRIVQKSQGGQLILLAIKDITERAMVQRKEKEQYTSTLQENKIQHKRLEISVEERTSQLLESNKLLEKNIAELERINEELQTFAFVSSHDLQEPLRKIQILTNMILKTEQALSDQGKDYFNRIESSAKRMRSLIKDLIAYSRVNAAEQKFEMTDLGSMIDEVLQEMTEAIQENNAEIKVDVQMSIPVIPFQFRQLFHNLLSNAIKFSKPGRNPQIMVNAKFEKTSKLNLNKKDTSLTDSAIITVSDNGIGFPKKYAEKIFTVFQKLHSKDEYEGTGIGLAIVKKIVLGHNGIITAESVIGKKTTFTIILPIKIASASVKS